MSENDVLLLENNNTQDEIRARREARRRKILENAKGRLEKLNGQVSHHENLHNGEINRSSREVHADPETELLEDVPFNVNAWKNDNIRSQDFAHFGGASDFLAAAVSGSSIGGNGTAQFQENIFDLLNNFSQIPLTTNFDDSPIQQHQQQQQQRQQQQQQYRPIQDSLIGKILKSKIHLALISLLTYILFSTGNERFISYSVFFPLLLWELIEYFLLKRHQRSQETSLFSIVLLVSGISPIHSNALLKTLGTMNKIFKDIGVFVFFFVLYNLFTTNILFGDEESQINRHNDTFINDEL